MSDVTGAGTVGPEGWRARAAQTRKRQTRERLLAAAERLFRERGYHATPVEEIAEQAGVGLGSLYNHFKGKGTLAATLWQPLCERLSAQVDAALAAEPLDVRAALRDHLAALATAMVDNRALTVALAEALLEESRLMQQSAAPEARVSTLVPLPAMLTRLFEAGLARGELRLVVPPSELAAFLISASLLDLVRRPARTAQELIDLLEQLVLGPPVAA
jgi:AcrR family transcriptional regulator